jgi:hypothetical protein
MATGKSNIILPGDEVIAMSYELFRGFGTDGNPVYHSGNTTAKDTLSRLNTLLVELEPVTEPYPAVSLGKLVAQTKNGSEIKIKLVFLMAEERYGGLVYINGQQYHAGPLLLEIIAQCK